MLSEGALERAASEAELVVGAESEDELYFSSLSFKSDFARVDESFLEFCNCICLFNV